MTIGSTHNHPADLSIAPASPMAPWAARFPNPPDLCFDYRRLIEQPGGIAQATRAEHHICIVESLLLASGNHLPLEKWLIG